MCKSIDRARRRGLRARFRPVFFFRRPFLGLRRRSRLSRFRTDSCFWRHGLARGARDAHGARGAAVTVRMVLPRPPVTSARVSLRAFALGQFLEVLLDDLAVARRPIAGQLGHRLGRGGDFARTRTLRERDRSSDRRARPDAGPALRGSAEGRSRAVESRARLSGSALGVCSALPSPPLSPLSAEQMERVKKIVHAVANTGVGMQAAAQQQ